MPFSLILTLFNYGYIYLTRTFLQRAPKKAFRIPKAHVRANRRVRPQTAVGNLELPPLRSSLFRKEGQLFYAWVKLCLF